jgi:hypothetical protein
VRPRGLHGCRPTRRDRRAQSALKLEHGQAKVRVEYRQQGQLRRTEFALSTLAGDPGFQALLAAKAVETIHSRGGIAQ